MELYGIVWQEITTPEIYVRSIFGQPGYLKKYTDCTQIKYRLYTDYIKIFYRL